MADSYRLRVPDALAEHLRRVHPGLQRKVRAALEAIHEDPSAGEKLSDDLAGLRSFPVGRFRIIYRPKRVIELVSVGPRRTIYVETLRLIPVNEEKDGRPSWTVRHMNIVVDGTRLTLVSFDIDGTLEIGEPPGIVSIALVRHAKRLGYVIGSCSDRPIGYQQAMWERLAIAVDFTALKHRLADVKARFAATSYYHIGDTDIDESFATGAGFRFLRADAAAHRSWGPELFAEPPRLEPQ